MNKKLFGLLIPLAIVSLAGCVKYNGRNKDGSPKTTSTSATSAPITDAPTATTVPVTPGEKITYYLNLGRHGKLKGAAGTEQAAVFLEYAIKVEGQSGDALPTKDDVTSDLTGVVFENWVLSGSQEVYTQVPTQNNCILVAVYSGSSEGGGSGGSGGSTALERTTNFPSTGYGLKFSDGTGYVGTPAGQDYSGRDQVVIHNAYFRKDEVFQLANFAPDGGCWAEPVDPYSFGGTSDTSENWKEYLQLNGSTNYKVLKDFQCEDIYIKLRYEDNIVYFK